jgi:hypothetical protein
MDSSGFVPVRALLECFHARLICRPLLVEGMLGSIESDASTGLREWVVLINSEKYAVSDMDVLHETSEQPLDARLRFTVAHELAHSLAFRGSEFGIQLKSANMGKFSDAELLAALEADADALASNLLCTTASVRDFFKSQRTATEISALANLRRRLGVSRPVLINRIRLLSSSSEAQLRLLPSLANTAFGIGTWRNERQAVIRNWPVFANFTGNLVPKFLLELIQHDRLPAIDAFKDRDFALCGGDKKSIEFSMPIGTPGTITDEEVELVASFEETRRAEDSTFIWIVSGKVRPKPPLT